MAQKADHQQPVVDRWWVETGSKEKLKPTRVTGPAGSRLFTAGLDFEQERALERLSDNNLKLLQQANPPQGGWAYVQLAEAKYPTRELERIKQLTALPRYARGAIVDSGRTVRLLVTGTPVGERILELALIERPSFDCWVDGEWVREAVFDGANSALRAFRKLVVEYLSSQRTPAVSTNG